VAAASGAMACSLARMVAAYSAGRAGDDKSAGTVAELAAQLERSDGLLRSLSVEDARAYEALTRSAKRLKEDPSTAGEHAIAVGVATAVPLEIAAVAGAALGVIERLLPLASTQLSSDLGVAAVLADASVHAASYMVHINIASLSDAESRTATAANIDGLIKSAAQTRVRIESAIAKRLR
jgi:methenyltetrahydrofolate cyclohydrolase